MSLVISAPSKTFFAGEYSALNGGPAILVATAPRFDLKVRNGAGFMSGIHGESPAGKLVRQHSSFFNQFDLEFTDPHMGRGGWGASTAQFLTCYSLLHWQGSAVMEMEKYFDTQQMLSAYKEVAWDGKGYAPSGADLIGQLQGGFTYFEKRRGLINNLRWNFSDLEFYLIPTGLKVSTHEHLKSLKDMNTEALENYVRKVAQAFSAENKGELLESLLHITKELEGRGWVLDKTQDYLKILNAIPGVLATKGCGALGADVVLAIVEKPKAVLFEALLKNEGKAYFSRHHISKGLDIYVEGDVKIDPYNAGILPS